MAGAFTALWTVILFQKVREHGNWLPWAIGLAGWLAGFFGATIRYRRTKVLGSDPEETDERLRAIETRAGNTAYVAQTFLLLFAIIFFSDWGAGPKAFPLGVPEMMMFALLFGSAVYAVAYFWHRYRV